MLFTTLQISGVEKCLADWNVSRCVREVGNQAHDHVAFDMQIAADIDDPIPYGTQVILRIGRAPNSESGLTPAGLPISGNTSWQGGKVFFVGWRVETFRNCSPVAESLEFKLAGPWEFFFERLIFQKLWFTWNGASNVADWRSQVILGQSVSALVGPDDTIPGTNATNLMSVRQQCAEIIAYVINQTITDYTTAQVQSDSLTSAIDGANWDLYISPGANLAIPDFIPGYAVSGKTSAQTGANAADQRTVLRAPLDAVNDITCAEALRRQLKWVGPLGDAFIWFDYTTTLAGAVCPTLKIGTRDQLPAIGLPFVGQQAGFKIKRRDDLTPAAIGLKFRITGTNSSGGLQTTVVNDIAGTISDTFVEGVGPTGLLENISNAFGGSPSYVCGSANSTVMQELQNLARDFNSVTQTVDMEGDKSTYTQCSIKTMAVNILDPSTNSGAIPFWQNIFPEFATLSATPALVSGTTVSVVVDDPGGADDGTAVNLSTYQYLLIDGQIPLWMQAGNVTTGAFGAAVQVKINAKWAIANVAKIGAVTAPGPISNYTEKTARATLVTIPGGTYQQLTSFTQGEVIPYGLAGFIYNIASIPQYEGSFTLQETEVTDQCPMGNNLNITGGRAEWATMNAAVQQISYDLNEGRTTITFGPAGHLGAKDMVERIRTNRGFRQLYGIGSNIVNASASQTGAQLGNSVAQRGPSKGGENLGYNPMLTSPTDAGSHTYSTGYPGINFDVRPSGQPNYGAISGLGAVGLPMIHLQEGSSGTLGRCVRISPGDLPSGAQAYFQQVSYSQCTDVEGTPTLKTYSFYILCTTPVSS